MIGHEGCLGPGMERSSAEPTIDKSGHAGSAVPICRELDKDIRDEAKEIESRRTVTALVSDTVRRPKCSGQSIARLMSQCIS
jgi:hypothetical protein